MKDQPSVPKVSREAALIPVEFLVQHADALDAVYMAIKGYETDTFRPPDHVFVSSDLGLPGGMEVRGVRVFIVPELAPGTVVAGRALADLTAR